MTVLIATSPSSPELTETKRFPLLSMGADTPPLPMAMQTGRFGSVFYFRQDSPEVMWAIKHNLGHYPQVTVEASLGAEALVIVEAEVEHVSVNECLILFGTTDCEGWAWLE